MTHQSSRIEYERRMHRVIEAIDQRLDQPLDLTSLAGVAHFSPYHFHRLFAAWTGETLGDYLRRRRLEQAASRLASQPRLPVLSAALGVGFGSGEAFSRAFKTRFGCSPSAWRHRVHVQRKHDQAQRKHDQAGHDAHVQTAVPVLQTHQELQMDVQLIERQPQRVAYMRHIGPYGEPIARFWMEDVWPWMKADGLMAAPRYGLSHDDPSITDASMCRYDACVEVGPDFVPSGRALVTTLPGGRYAVLPFKGTNKEAFAAWASLLRDWLPASELQLDNRPCFEFYFKGSSFDPTTGVFDCHICIPVAPL